MGLYNPNDQCIIGPEWYPSRRGLTVLDSDLKAVGYILTASTSDDIGYVWNFLQQQTNDYSVINMEIFDITDGEIPLLQTQNFTYYPGDDIFVGPKPWTPGSFNTSDPGSLIGPYWSCIDSPSLTPGIWPNSGAPVNNDEFVFNFFGLGYDFAVSFDGVAGTQDGRWITRVRQRFVCAQYLDLGAEGAFEIQPYMWINGTKCTGPRYTVSAADGVTDLYHDWYYSPLIGAPWTSSDIDRFDTTYSGPDPGDPYWVGQNGMGWVCQPTGSSNNLATLLQGQMIVESSPDDPRLALGSTIFPPRAQGWKPVNVRDVGTNEPFSLTLVPGRRYMFMMRRGNSLGPIAPSFLTDINLIDIPGAPLWTSSLPRLDSVTRRPMQIGDESPNAYGVILETDLGSEGPPDFGVASDDSQIFTGLTPPNGSIDEYPWLGHYFKPYRINSNAEMRQTFTVNDTNEYGWIWTVVSRLPSQGGSDLTITVRDTATDTVQGSPAIITVDDLKYPNRWYKIGVRLPGALPTLVAGDADYYLEFTSPAAPVNSWVVQVMRFDPIINTETPYLVNPGWYRPVPPPGPIWGPNDFIEYGPSGDLETKINVRAVTSIATIPEWDGDDSLAVAATEEVCNFSHVNLTWEEFIEPEEECVPFGWYEIERSYDQVNWEIIAQIDSIGVEAASDYETRANTPVYYRMRVVRGDGAASDWSNTDSTTVPMSSPGLSFTANAAPDLTVGYQDIGQMREFNFPENFEVFQPQGQNYQVFYREIEDRGVTFNAKLRIRAGREACLPLCDEPLEELYGDDVFGPLKAICRAGIPYVCVRNESGNIWFAFVTTPSGQWTQHGMEITGGVGIYTMDIEVTQVTSVPEPFNVTPEP